MLLNDDAKISREINIEKDSIFVTDIVNSKRKDNIIKIVLNFHPDIKDTENNKEFTYKNFQRYPKIIYCCE